MCSIFNLPARLFIPNGCSESNLRELDWSDLMTGAKRLNCVAHIFAGIGFTALVAAAVFGAMIVAGVTFAALATLTVPLLVGALAISAVAFSLSYVALASRKAILDARFPGIAYATQLCR